MKSATLYETSFMPSQLRLFDLGEEGWVKFLKLEEYAARLPRRVYVTGGVRVLTLNLWGCRGRGTSAGPSWPTACAGSDADSVAFWRGRRSLEGTSVCYRDAWESARPREAGHTFTPTNPLVAENKRALDRGRRIDYVFVRCDDSLHGPTLDVRARTLAFAESVGGVWVSDHFGFVAELSVPDVCS